MLEQLLTIGVTPPLTPVVFLDEVPVTEFITGNALASAIG